MCGRVRLLVSFCFDYNGLDLKFQQLVENLLLWIGENSTK